VSHPNPDSLTPAQSKAWARRVADWLNYCRACEALGVDRKTIAPAFCPSPIKEAWRRFLNSDRAYHNAMKGWGSLSE
jgi:hypothetical protein